MTRCTLTAALLLGLSASLWADCVDGARDTTPAEKQFYLETMATLKGFVPPAPAGWRLEDRNITDKAPGSVCIGSGKLPQRATYEVRYYWQDGIAEQQRRYSEFEKKIVAVRELPPEQQKQFDDLGRTSRDLERQARKLAATDKAQAESLREQSRAIWKQVVDMRQAHLQSVIPQLTELAMQRERATGEVCTDIKLTIDVNGYNLEVPEGATALSYPGSAVALRGPKHIVIGYGPWAKTAGSIKARYSAGATTRIQGLAIKADGDAKQLDQFVAAMNSPSLAALVKN